VNQYSESEHNMGICMLYNLTEVVPHGGDFCAISTKEVATTWYDFYKTLIFPSPLCARCIVRPQLWMESPALCPFHFNFNSMPLSQRPSVPLSQRPITRKW